MTQHQPHPCILVSILNSVDNLLLSVHPQDPTGPGLSPATGSRERSGRHVWVRSTGTMTKSTTTVAKRSQPLQTAGRNRQSQRPELSTILLTTSFTTGTGGECVGSPGLAAILTTTITTVSGLKTILSHIKCELLPWCLIELTYFNNITLQSCWKCWVTVIESPS